MSRPRILISEPNSAGQLYPTLPYVWAVLKSYWEHYGSSRDAFTWLDPIFDPETTSSELKGYSRSPPDVLGLSCYTWNWDLQCDIARWAKGLNPNCLVVAGGPDPDYKDPEFFLKHPYIDLIVVKDGEIPFTAILDTFSRGGRDFSRIPGLYLPRRGSAFPILDLAGAHIFTGPGKVPEVFDYSPYLEQRELYERIVTTRGFGKVNATLETNRGCPYSCSFCDWGSATMSKVRKFDMERVGAEADWMGRIGVFSLLVADANFGIFPRDVEVADRLVATRAKYQYPKFLYYNAAKNNPERTVEIARRTHAAGLTSMYTLSVQHTDPSVLAATERSNIPAAKYREMVASLVSHNIACNVQLIVGIPGDTPAKWKRSLAEIMDWGVHDSFYILPYQVLPNAPAAEKSFTETWQVETVSRLMIPYEGSRRKGTEGAAKSSVVVASRTFSRKDWVEMITWSNFVKAYHNRALTRLPALYLRFAYGVPYREFYEAVIGDFCKEAAPIASLYAVVQALYERFLLDPQASDEMELEMIPECPFLVEPSRWLFVNTCLRLDDFYSGLSDFLAVRFPAAMHLRSAIDYQKNMVITPDYRFPEPKTFRIERDWPDFFRRAQALTHFEPLSEPVELPASTIAEVTVKAARELPWLLDFGSGSKNLRLTRWAVQTVVRQNSAIYSLFPEVRVRPARCYSGLQEAGTPRNALAWLRSLSGKSVTVPSNS